MTWSRKKPPANPQPVQSGAGVAPAPDDSEESKADWASMAAWEERAYDIAFGGLDRSRTGATTVQAASAAIATLYTGALGFVFSTTSSSFPLRGLLTPLFLGLAVVLSTFYLAFLTPATKYFTSPPGGQATVSKNVWARVNDVGDRVDKVAGRRAWAIRSAVVALGVGLVCMPLPFITSTSFSQTPTAAVTPTSWPTPPPVDGSQPGSVDFGKILYQAQIDQFRADLKDSNPEPNGFVESGWFFLSIFGVGALLVVFLPLAARRGDKKFREEQKRIRESSAAPANGTSPGGNHQAST
ncbi:hypothetical protein ABH923_000311 [Leifsonia sp. EB41]|uniref:hypothetical protein n=1 Tax=Leifsonia sp. EB41 TaxID=3156260 RepID=UPI0035124B58